MRTSPPPPAPRSRPSPAAPWSPPSWGGAYGNQVVIRHSDGRYSQYGHLSSLSVSAGQTVNTGQQIGAVGSTGNSTGPHLHFEIRTAPGYGSDIDPLAYLRANGVSI
ncbi:M23 family metallopeptidase [Streptomyces radiopugnans]|nr:M23 family metallopeptidase [Streptomyces radiopugnans]